MSTRAPANLCGALIPWDFSPTYAPDHVHGADYTEADRRAGEVATPDGRKGRLTAFGNPDDDVQSVELLPIAPGLPVPDGAAVAVRVDGGTWYGSEGAEQLTGTASFPWAVDHQVDIITLDDGRLLAAWTELASGVWTALTATRGIDGVWSSSSTLATWSNSSSFASAGVALVQTPYEILAYTMGLSGRGGDSVQMLASKDSGATWVLQSSNVGIDVPATGVSWLVAVYIPGDQIVLWATDNAATKVVKQVVSYDRGASFDDTVSTTTGWVFDAVFARGAVVVARNVQGNAELVSIGSGEQSHSTATVSVQVEAVAVGGGSLVVEPTEVVWARLGGIEASTTGVYVTQSTDGGVTWETLGEHTHALSGPAYLAGTYSRGEQVCVVGGHDGTTRDGRAVLYCYGGLGDLTLTDSTPLMAVHWGPVQTLESDLFAPADSGGTATRTLLADREEWFTDASTTASAPRLITVSTTADTLWAKVRLLVVSGTAVIRLDLGSGAGDIEVRLTSTAINVNNAPAPPPTTYTAAEFIEVVIGYRALDGTGFAAWSADPPDDGVREYTEITGLPTLTITSGVPSIDLGALPDSSVQWLMVAAGEAFGGSVLFDGLDRPEDLAGVPLSSEGVAYIGSGLSVRGSGRFGVGPDSYELSMTAPGPKPATLPQVEASPRKGLVTDSGDEIVLRYTLCPEVAGVATLMPPGAFGVYLAGLHGVGDVLIRNGASETLGLFIRPSIDYTLSGSTLQTSSVSDKGSLWVYEHELAGWYFEDDNGVARRIKGNTEGMLDISSDHGHIATIELEDVDGTEAATGTGRLYPDRLLFLIYHRGDSPTLTEINLTMSAHTAFDRKEVGLVAAGPVHIMGRGIDYTDSATIEGGAGITRLEDGSSARSSRAPVRQRWEYQIGVDSVVDITDVRRTTHAPDAVSLGATLDASRHGTPLSVQGLYRRLDGQPFVFLPTIPYDTTPDTGRGAVAATPWRDCFNASYGRIVGTSRRSNTLGDTNSRGMMRSSTMTIEEEP